MTGNELIFTITDADQATFCEGLLYEFRNNETNGFVVNTMTQTDLWMDVTCTMVVFNPYPTAFPYGNGMVLHFYQQQESSTTKTVHKVINKGLKTYV